MLYNVKFLQNLLAVVMVIGRLMCRVMNIAPLHFRYKVCT